MNSGNSCWWSGRWNDTGARAGAGVQHVASEARHNGGGEERRRVIGMGEGIGHDHARLP